MTILVCFDLQIMQSVEYFAGMTGWLDTKGNCPEFISVVKTEISDEWE